MSGPEVALCSSETEGGLWGLRLLPMLMSNPKLPSGVWDLRLLPKLMSTLPTEAAEPLEDSRKVFKVRGTASGSQLAPDTVCAVFFY